MLFFCSFSSSADNLKCAFYSLLWVHSLPICVFNCLQHQIEVDSGRLYDLDPEKRRKDYDAEGDKIEKRIKRERPCRVLFIRNVKVDS